MAADDLVQPVQFALLTLVADRRGERVSDQAGEIAGTLPDRCDVAVGAGDVRAAGLAVADVRCAAGSAVVAGEAARGLGRVKDAGHASAGEDLQAGIGQHGRCFPAGAGDSAGEPC